MINETSHPNPLISDEQARYEIEKIEREHGIVWRYEQKFISSKRGTGRPDRVDIKLLNGYEDFLDVECHECGWFCPSVDRWHLLIAPVPFKCTRNGRYKTCMAEWDIVATKEANEKFIKQIQLYMKIDRYSEELIVTRG